MKHYVAYHKVEEYGEYKVLGGYRHFSRFPRKRLENMVGQTVWVISGTKTSNGTIYKLCSTYTPDQVLDEGGGVFCVFGLQGKSFKPHIELNQCSWFDALLKEQRNFGLGMRIIGDKNVIGGLVQIAKKFASEKEQSSALHICVGRTSDLELIVKAIENETAVEWPVPKDAEIGDSILFLIPSRTGPFEAQGKVMEKPVKSATWKNKYQSAIGHLEILPVAVSLSEAQSLFPNWKYLTNAKSYITVPAEYADALTDMIEECQQGDYDIDEISEFNPQNLVEAKELIAVNIALRRGQPKFRATLLDIYNTQCAITGYTSPDALEAAHIIPYKGTDFHHPSNGLLLRADIHTLFDLHLLAVDTTSMTVLISPRLESTSYNYLSGKKLFLPKDKKHWPSAEALDIHREEAKL